MREALQVNFNRVGELAACATRPGHNQCCLSSDLTRRSRSRIWEEPVRLHPDTKVLLPISASLRERFNRRDGDRARGGTQRTIPTGSRECVPGYRALHVDCSS